MTKFALTIFLTLIFSLLEGLIGLYPLRHNNEVSVAAAFVTSEPSGSLFRPRSLPEGNPDGESLRTYAERIGLYLGSMEDSLPGNGWETDWVRKTLGTEFNLLEPGNQLKWWVTEPTRGTFDFRSGDELVDFAIAHNMKVRGHNLLWGMANPNWLGNEGARKYDKFSGQQLKEILVNHIRNVMGHYREKYPGVVKWWDVTNELMGWNNEFNSDGILWSKIGSSSDRADYVRVAFETARAADPSAVLCMNDWGNEGSLPDRTRNMIATVSRLKKEGVPIDCVGMEAHLNSSAKLTIDEVKRVMKAYGDMGVQVQITEFDVHVPISDSNAWSVASKIATTMLESCVESPNCTAFNNWGFSQAFYFNDSGNSALATMLPWDRNNHKSAEYEAMRSALKKDVKE